MLRTVFLSILICFAHSISAEESQEDASKWRWALGLDGGTASIDTELAEQEGIEDEAYVLGIFANYGSDDWLATAGLDLFFYDDNRSFRVDVENTLFGDRSVESSDASGISVYGAFGPRWFLSDEKRVEVFTKLGAAAMVSSERSISNCSDCPSEDIEVDAGLFAQAGINYYFDALAVGLSIQPYFSGDIEHTLRLTVTTSPF